MAMPLIAAEEAAGAVSSVRAAKGASAASKGARAGRVLPPAGGRAPRKSGSTPATKPEHIPTTEEVNAGVTSADLEAKSSAAPAPTSSGAGAVAMPAAAETGSGFLLGLFAWALGLAYLRGGSTEVRRFMAAKFLNKTES